MSRLGVAVLLCLCPIAGTAENAVFNAAAAFGARPSVSDLTLSPDGMNVAWLAPAQGQGSILYTMSLAKDAKPTVAAAANGKPDRLGDCSWVSNERLVCTILLSRKDGEAFQTIERVIAVNSDGKNPQMLSRPTSFYAHGFALGGGTIIDWLPGEDNAVLMTRNYVPDDHAGTRLGSTDRGLGVDRLDTRSLQTHRVEPPMPNSWGFISDGQGTVRIAIVGAYKAGGSDTGDVEFLYHPSGARDWKLLSRYNIPNYDGYYPVAVDSEQNVAYGYQRLDGRNAIYTMSLDEAHDQHLVYANPDFDISHLITLGRRHRVIGASYISEYRHAEYFSADIKALINSLGKALKHPALNVISASLDENRMLILTSTDTDPGVYYIFDRKSHQLQTFFVVRNELEGVKLAKMVPVSYAAHDGTIIPAYLTLPPGREDAKGLPAIVMPHGGPSARDVWGFDWLVQFFANRGYAVLQPNFRGSFGYGEGWFRQNGFRSWDVAIGDVLDAGRWLVKEGFAAPDKLGIFGWSYGGYAALQSAVVDPTLFKAVVAVAPVTDLNRLKEDSRYWSNFELVSDFIGSGPHMHEGSPSEHADRFRVPVLLFHGTFDANVNIEQSRIMERKLKAAGAKVTFVTFDDLDHQLNDSAARAQVLEQSDQFLQAAFGH